MSKDLAFEKDLKDDPKKSIRSGFLWIGIASTVSQVLSAVTMLLVMLFMSKEEMGAATLALSFSVLFEAFNSLGTNQGMLQAKELTPNEAHSLFWFNTCFGVGIFILACPLAWPIASFYENDALVPLLITAMFKMPLVCTASVPFQLINRRFEYQKISVTNTLTSIACSVLKIGLAACGFGAWSLVIGDTAYGLGTLIGGLYFSKYKPMFHFQFSECTRFIKFGVKYCFSGCLDKLNKNLHYLIVGKLLGDGTLGVYRISYELAMTPAMALFDVVGKSSYPVFARLQDKRDELARLFLWNQQNIAFFASIAVVALLFVSEDVFRLMPNPEWMEAIPVIPFALALSLFRAIAQAYPDLYRACGHPEYPIYTGAFESLCVFVIGSGALLLFPEFGLVAMLCAWLGIMISFLVLHCWLSRRLIPISLKKSIYSMRHALGFIMMSSAVSIPVWMVRGMLPWAEWTHIIIEFFLLLICLYLYSRFVMKISVKDLFSKKKKNQDEGNKA